MENSSKVKGIAVIAIAIIGIILMIFKSGLLGIVLYLIAGVISFISLPKENRNVAYIKDTIQNIDKETLLTNDIFAIILALAPIAIALGLFMWFYIEPIRAADKLIDDTANVKQLYYEDISAMNTNQNSNSNDLTGYLIETALTAWTNTCELVIHFAGGEHKINTLFKPEAERVVAIYHQCRKAQKEAASQPTVIQQAAQPDVLEQIQKLSALKDAGIIDEAEFAQKKADLLAKL